VKLELEDIKGNEYTETIPKYPSARVKNQCEAAFNAYVKATGSEEEGAIDNAMEALSEQKNIVIEWLNQKWFDADLSPDKIAPPSQTKVVAEYAEFIEGMQVDQKKSQDQTTKESETK